jgi:SET domain-containing protein
MTKIKHYRDHVSPSYCHRSHYNLIIKQSSIQNAGLGVFTNEFIPKGQIIDEYFGELLELDYSPSKYYFEIKDGLGIDAFNYPRCFMAMINDAYETVNQNNCDFTIDTTNNQVFVLSIRDIHQNEELFISYGDYYWT